MTPNVRLYPIDSTALRYGPLSSCSQVYDNAIPLKKAATADGVPPGYWFCEAGTVILGHAPDGIVTGDIKAEGAVSHVFQPGELPPESIARRGEYLRFAGLLA